MKKLLAVIAVVMIFSVAAAKDYFGVYILGGQYTIGGSETAPGGIRLAVGLPLFFGLVGGGGVLGLDGSADYLLPGGKISDDGKLQWYYGGGVGLAFVAATGGGSIFGINPRALAGLDYNLGGGLSVFGEVGLGINIYVSGLSGVGFGPTGRFGLNFR